ncbi:WbqC family protein [Sulfurimonas sp.]|uniref:WbqC family protein n=1 Tax=Sulfurimonas sp. TaxID=2022749 RepID=UPI00261719DE|nr:WbqC family protein [Sulfurimonas sp.]MDD5157882.1 WbqC family protein [Sulfurimonas sp.]
MTLAIMQPYLFPYIGYWQLINIVDTFVVYDNIQFSKSGWFNRNNILLNGKKTLFSMPLRKDSDSLDVVDRFISDEAQNQINKILSQIQSGYNKAPYFKDVFPLVKNIFMYDEKNLFKYIHNSIVEVCTYLDIDTHIIISSAIDIDHSLKSQEKVIALNKTLGSSQYINPIGGTVLYNADTFKNENIKLKFLESEVPEYKQFNNEFIPYLSIIDVLMFNSKEDVKLMLKRYKLI